MTTRTEVVVTYREPDADGNKVDEFCVGSYASDVHYVRGGIIIVQSREKEANVTRRTFIPYDRIRDVEFTEWS